MTARLAITGFAVVTPLDDPRPAPAGCGTWAALATGARVEERRSVAEELLEGDAGLDRSIRMALKVAGGALDMSGSRADVGLFCGTSKGPVGVMLAALDRLRRNETLENIEALQLALGVGAMGPLLAGALGLEPCVAHTSVAACASGIHALHRAARALWRGECSRALVVAADASLHGLFEASFARLGVLAPQDARGIRRCEPFGESGKGFFISEAAAAILLERQEECLRRGARVLARLDSCWIGGDGTDLIAVDPDTHSLRRGLATCAGDPRGLAFVHAHATGTRHDRYERQAIAAIVGSDVPVYSSKGSLGHCLGAAGLVSVVLSAQSHIHGSLPNGVVIRPGRSLTVAQGFGGHLGVVGLMGERS